jgi:hypothetical protein
MLDGKGSGAGSGVGSIPRTYGSGSRRSKNIRLLRIRIRNNAPSEAFPNFKSPMENLCAMRPMRPECQAGGRQAVTGTVGTQMESRTAGFLDTGGGLQ